MRAAVVAVTLALLAELPAHADTEETARRAVGAAAQRARRAIALGPSAGIGGAYAPSPGETDAAVTFGLALRMFKVPVIPDVQEMITEKVKARTTERVRQMIANGAPPPDEAELARIGMEILEEVKAEVLGERPRPGRLLEKPRLAITLEGARFLRADAWQVRGTIALGVWKFTVGPVIGGLIGDADGLMLGGEIAVHLTPWKGPRSPVIDVYGRYEVGVTDQVSEGDLVTIGTRFLLDLI
jgi:hypothetical protein